MNTLKRKRTGGAKATQPSKTKVPARPRVFVPPYPVGEAASSSADMLVFYSGSKDAAPGKGVHERVESPGMYAALRGVPNWRKVLSNFHVCPFEFNGERYQSIEHVFQSYKIRLADAVKARHFTLDSGHDIGQGDGAVAQKHRRYVRLTRPQLEYWDAIQQPVMESAAYRKYQSCPEALAVLKATHKAQLWHLVKQRGKPSTLVRFHHLERIRQALS